MVVDIDLKNVSQFLIIGFRNDKEVIDEKEMNEGWTTFDFNDLQDVIKDLHVFLDGYTSISMLMI